MTGPLRIGIMGCADIARRRMLPAMARAPLTEVVAVAGRDPARTRELAAVHGCRPVDGYAALLADDAVEAVYVPLPASLHAEWAEAALRSGRHVLVEKPAALRRESVRRLVELASGSGLALMENVMFVHHGRHAVVRKLLADRAIGELRGFEAHFTVPRRSEDDIRRRPELGGGALWDTGVYPLRAARHFLGSGLRVVGASLVRGPGHRVDSSGAALLVAPDGTCAHLSFGLDHAYRSGYALWGTGGSITVDRAFTPGADLWTEIRLDDGSEPRVLRQPPEDQAYNTVMAFAAAARAGGTADAICLEQARLLDDVRAAAART
ncbi:MULTISPECIES: Gfo/Idh/MocA family protein [Streptomyces]|uniref:Gfo/Idh/MocA family oxidoreductase n=1 Tax=Streptomyces doudnae TaxID=3075536 RepID=A0ABD5EQD3_9ACTN|nr:MULTISPECIES: Gfo/Idh/MocA family oxidoreductase [unclassified Streptomyces]MDT0436259.1 Gfo/Idh/MocA family oxidoreductase [Streptomyces sp. DSM 41981]SCE41273.1 Predicted dehydrogenase [Streptomyces sp. SolWspMP-5a-2]